jgi:hypothetical protein
MAETRPTNEHLANIDRSLDLLRSERWRLIADAINPPFDPANIANRLTKLASIQEQIKALKEARDDETDVAPKGMKSAPLEI